jgi:putative membrane protein
MKRSSLLKVRIRTYTSKLTKQGNLAMLERKMLTAALVAVGVIISLEYASVAQQTTPTSQPTQPATQPNQTKISNSDKQFVIEAAQGGMAEVSLGQLATKRAISKDVRQYAQDMIADHTKANAELMKLATQKGITVPKNMDAKGQALMTQLSKLSGKSFDQAYMKEAGVKSHAEQVALFQRQAQQGGDPQLKAFAAKTLPTVQEHLQMARDMTGNTSGANQNPSSPSPMK